MKTDNRIYLWSCAMFAIVHEWVHAIYAHCSPNIPRIFGKFLILWINVLSLCGINRMSYQFDILLMLLFVPLQQFWLLFVANQRFKWEMIGKYQNTFLGPPFLLLQFSSSSPYFLRLNRPSPQIGHFPLSSNSFPWYRMQSFLHVVGISLPRASKSRTRKDKKKGNKHKTKESKTCGEAHKKLGSTSIALG
jgi:hypothetical protein